MAELLDFVFVAAIGGGGLAYVTNFHGFKDYINGLLNIDGGDEQGCGSKTCQAGQHLTTDCKCMSNTVCGGKTCQSGQTLNAATCQCVTDGPGPTPGAITWTSAAWNNGKSRSYNFSGGDCIGNKDPYDSKFYASHAGSGCGGACNGHGEVTLHGNRCRYYVLGKNYNGMMQFQFKFGGSGNLSLKLRSRHDEGDCSGNASPANRFGGYGPAIHWEGGSTSIECKREDYHNLHTPMPGTKNTSQKLVAGRWYGIRATCQDRGGSVVVRIYIDYNLNGKYVKEFESVDSHPIASAVNKPLFDKRSYCWFRTNTGANVTIRNASISEIGPLTSSGVTYLRTNPYLPNGFNARFAQLVAPIAV